MDNLVDFIAEIICVTSGIGLWDFYHRKMEEAENEWERGAFEARINRHRAEARAVLRGIDAAAEGL